MTIEQLQQQIENKKIILIGETHGVEKNIDILHDLCLDLSKKETINLCIELPENLQGMVDYFMTTGEEDVLANINFEDGRDTYIGLIKRIYKINLNKDGYIKVFCVDPVPRAITQKEKEEEMCKSIIKIIQNNISRVVVVLGEIHASKNEVNIQGVKVISTGFLLNKVYKDKLFSIRLSNNVVSKNKDNIEEIKFNEGFDYILEIERLK